MISEIWRWEDKDLRKLLLSGWGLMEILTGTLPGRRHSWSYGRQRPRAKWRALSSLSERRAGGGEDDRGTGTTEAHLLDRKIRSWTVIRLWKMRVSCTQDQDERARSSCYKSTTVTTTLTSSAELYLMMLHFLRRLYSVETFLSLKPLLYL